MQIISIVGLRKNSENYNKALGKTVEILKNDGVIIHPTETCYGLAANIFSEEAVKKIYEIKKMPFSKPASILVSSVEEAKKYGEWNELAQEYADLYWPGPLTLILKRKSTVPDFLNTGIARIGIRFSSHGFSTDIVKNLGMPVITTSANISGNPPCYSHESVLKIFYKTALIPDLLIDEGALDASVPPSTVIDISRGTTEIIRGSIKRKIAKP